MKTLSLYCSDWCYWCPQGPILITPGSFTASNETRDCVDLSKYTWQNKNEGLEQCVNCMKSRKSCHTRAWNANSLDHLSRLTASLKFIIFWYWGSNLGTCTCKAGGRTPELSPWPLTNPNKKSVRGRWADWRTAGFVTKGVRSLTVCLC